MTPINSMLAPMRKGGTILQHREETDAVLDCAAFMICDGNAVLAERRKMTRKVLPGALALPGGHLEPGESIEPRWRAS